MTDLADLTAFISARLAETETKARSDPARIAWLTYLNGDGQMRYTTVAADHDDDYWCADGKLLDVPSSACVVYDPAHVLRDVAATRKLVTEITAIPHEYVEGDSWYSCSRAVYPESPDDEPGSACADDDRAGKPCDCGRDKRALRLLGTVAERWDDHADYQEGWRP